MSTAQLPTRSSYKAHTRLAVNSVHLRTTNRTYKSPAVRTPEVKFDGSSLTRKPTNFIKDKTRPLCRSESPSSVAVNKRDKVAWKYKNEMAYGTITVDYNTL
jgi:hypothetical protein